MAQPGPGSQTQAGTLTADALARVREVLRLPQRSRGGRMESADTARWRASLDLAIIGVMADGGLRRSEAAALTWGDVELWADGTGRLTIQKGKNQVEPATVAVTAATARALRGYPARRRRPRRLCVRTDRRDPGQPGAGHSAGGRSGRRVHWTQRPHRDGPADGSGRGAQRGGAAQGRWKHGDMVARYTRGEAAGEALK